jgi:two-component system response regulator HydG/two-component system response regulator AtoC
MRLQAVFPARDNLPMIGSGPLLADLRRMLVRVASSNCTVLITGETGTGKELAAEFIHRNSVRRTHPFVGINCAAIPDSLLESELFGHSRGAFTGASEQFEGLLTSANGGTVFLDEIGDMTLMAQAKILRVLEKKEICRIGCTRPMQLDIRFIAATNQNLAHMTELGTFRKDLFFRLNVAHVPVPPLRERKEDIPLLLDHYRREFHAQHAEGNQDRTHEPIEFSETCLNYLLRYDWPGNIRELKNMIECLTVTEHARTVEPEHLPCLFRSATPNSPPACESGGDLRAHETRERESLISALSMAKGNKSAAAKRLRWSRMTLYRKLVKHKLISHHESYRSPQVQL